jgi:hypothetical protein
MLLMEIKGKQFDLLTQAVGGSTPLVHAMRHGPSRKSSETSQFVILLNPNTPITDRDVAILLTGAISRKVNDLTDEDLANLSLPTRSTLRAIRANLRIAIQYGLQTSQTDLIASYLQVIIMSEGDKFVRTSAQTAALALRSGPAGKPVETVENLLEKWVSKELKAQEIASVSVAFYVHLPSCTSV